MQLLIGIGRNLRDVGQEGEVGGEGEVSEEGEKGEEEGEARRQPKIFITLRSSIQPDPTLIKHSLG